MTRRSVSGSADKSYFRNTASHTRAINLPVMNYRGGIRL